MAGIYIHIPFCKKACHYCNFHFSTSLQLQDELINALVQEIVLQKNYFNETVQTIYFGGGTPSLLTTKQIESIIATIYKHYTVADNNEFTFEANPDDITPAKINEWNTLGINRLSIGVQSFVEDDLQWMNRAHNVLQAKECITNAVANGITNLSIDLIYGTPNLSNANWIINIETAMQLGVQHLSCYALTVEDNTALAKMIATKKKEPVDPNKAAEQMELLMQVAPSLGLEHYEISNLAKQGFRSKHNSAYWQGNAYLGIGPSAHSYNGTTRQWNIANNALYIQSIKNNTIPFEIETLTESQQLNEYIMTSLRTIEGCAMHKIDIALHKNLERKLEKFVQSKLVVVNNNFIQLTNAGKLRADGIAAELFV